MHETVEVPDAPSAAFDFMYEQGWTDGLPVIPPTRSLVDAMIAATDRAPQDVIGHIPPQGAAATVEAVAINAVMAGCRSEYAPVLVAVVEALCAPELNLAGIQTTGDSVGPGVVVNGPIRGAIDLNCSEGVAGPGRRANATIGRAIRLILINLGGGRPGTTDRAMIGQPAKFALCLGENEEKSPWEPYHVSRGIAADQSYVTVIPVLFTQFAWPLVLNAETTLSSMTEAMATAGHSNPAYSAAPVTWIIPPANAKLLAAAGYGRPDIQQHLFREARIPLALYPRDEREQMWDYDILIEGGQVLVTRSPDDILIFVAGGDDYTGSLYLGGWEAAPVSVPV